MAAFASVGVIVIVVVIVIHNCCCFAVEHCINCTTNKNEN